MFMRRGSDGRLEELGKVYVYLQRGPLLLEPSRSHLLGQQAFGRFGTSLAPLGDLNQDGFNGTCTTVAVILTIYNDIKQQKAHVAIWQATILVRLSGLSGLLHVNIFKIPVTTGNSNNLQASNLYAGQDDCDWLKEMQTSLTFVLTQYCIDTWVSLCTINCRTNLCDISYILVVWTGFWKTGSSHACCRCL